MSDRAREMFISTIRKVAEEFAEVQPISVSTENLKRSMDRVLAAFRSMAIGNPKLYECTPASVARAVALSAMTGLMPGRGTLAQVDLIPRKRRVKVDDQWREFRPLVDDVVELAQFLERTGLCRVVVLDLVDGAVVERAP